MKRGWHPHIADAPTLKICARREMISVRRIAAHLSYYTHKENSGQLGETGLITEIFLHVGSLKIHHLKE
jgi:hypothetical protein